MTKAFQNHNHKTCKAAILKQVRARAKSEGLRLTDMRMRVLSILLERHHAMGAYDILTHLVSEGEPAQPPIVYRALSFLTEHDFAHKVESQNAYIACQFPEKPHHAGLMICRTCKAVGEARVEAPVLMARDFHVETEIVEAEGLCQSCYEVRNDPN